MVERGTKPLTRDLAEGMASLYGVTMQAVIDAAPMVADGITAESSALEQVVVGAHLADENHEAQGVEPPPTPVDAAAPERAAKSEPAPAASALGGTDTAEDEWFAGSDAHSMRRRQLRDAAADMGFTEIEAKQIAVASHPPLSGALASYDFFVELERQTDDFNRRAQRGSHVEIVPLTRLTLRELCGTAAGHEARVYATSLAALLAAGEPTSPDEHQIGVDDYAPSPRPVRDLEDFQAVAEDRRTILFDERGTGSERRFDAYATATQEDRVLAAGFDHQRGVIRAVDLSKLATRPRLAPAPDDHFDPPNQGLVEEAEQALAGLDPDPGSTRLTAGTSAQGQARDEPFATVSLRGVSRTSSQPDNRPILPAAVDLIVGSHHLFLDREIRARGAVGFVLADPDTGSPARGGVRVSEADGLPDFVVLGEEQVRLEPTHRWLPEENRYAPEPEPFERARASHTRVMLAGRAFDLDLRVSRRSDVQWIIRAKLTPAEESLTTPEDEMPPKPSIKGAPVLPTPLFKLDGRWNWRWSVRTSDNQLILPRQLFEMNGVEADSLASATLPDGTDVELIPTKYGTGLSVQRVGAFRKASKGRPGDYVFIASDVDGALSFHRVTKQLMGRVQSHMKMASLLCGLTEEHPTLAAVLWALGVDESGTIEDAIAICEQRSDGPLARELRSQATEAGPPPDLDEIFKAL